MLPNRRHAIRAALFAAMLAFILRHAADPADLGARTSRMWECTEWTLANPSCADDPGPWVYLAAVEEASGPREEKRTERA